MGAGVSSIMGPEGEAIDSSLGDMPESCVAAVLLHLDVQEICSVARLNRAFRGAASADFVWETKLPKNYKYLVDLVESDEKLRGECGKCGGLCKKEIYAMLCRPSPFDGGCKEFWIEKRRGQVCMAISSKAMAITGIDDRRYWTHIPTEESRFQSVAFLHQIWWLEVTGEINFSFSPGIYSLYFRLHLGRPTKRLGRPKWVSDNVHGWDQKPVTFNFTTIDNQSSSSVYHLSEYDSWVLYKVGDFSVGDSGGRAVKVRYSMTQIDCTHTKGGLSVDSVLVYPKGFGKEKDIVVSM